MKQDSKSSFTHAEVSQENYHANNLGRDIDNAGLPKTEQSPRAEGPITFTNGDET